MQIKLNRDGLQLDQCTIVDDIYISDDGLPYMGNMEYDVELEMIR